MQAEINSLKEELGEYKVNEVCTKMQWLCIHCIVTDECDHHYELDLDKSYISLDR